MNFDNFEQYLRNEKGYSSNTIIAYLNDLTQFAKIIKNDAYKSVAYTIEGMSK